MSKKVLRLNFFDLVKAKELAEQRDVTNREISEATGLSEHAIGRWRKNRVGKFSLDDLAAMLTFFDCSIDDLLVVEEVVDSDPA